MSDPASDDARTEAVPIQAEKFSLSERAATVAHDLNNSLAAIVAFSQLIRSDPALPEDLRHHADLLVQEADRTRTIVGSLLELARAEGPVAGAPLPPPARSDDPRSASTSKPGAPERADARTARVLVLDDEPSIRDFLGRVLARAGYEPVLAATGDAALVVVRSDPPDAILCDHRMAGMTGTEFHAAVIGIDPALGSRFAFMSGDVLSPDLRRFAKERGAQLLAKPFDIASVGAMVRTLLGGATA